MDTTASKVASSQHERGHSLEGVIAAETAKVAERALATFGPGEREAVIQALTAIRRNLTGA